MAHSSPTTPAHGFRRAPALTLALVASVTQFDVTSVAVALPTIGADLGFTMQGVAWVVDAYSLAFTSFLLASGALADRHGRRRVLVLGNVGFALASLACGVAGDAAQLCAARALQGMAAAFLITGGLASLSAAYPDPSQRLRAFGIMGVASGASMALGPTLGGWLSAGFGWRAIFLVNLPICLAAGLLIPRLVQETRDPEGRPLDWTATALLTAAMTLIVHALLAFVAPPVQRASEAALSAFAVALFARRQKRAARPMFDSSLFLRPAVIGVGCQLVAMSVGYWAVLVFAPAYLQQVHGFAPDQAGAAMLSATLPMALLPAAGVAMAARWGWRITLTSGMGLVAVGIAGAAWTAIVAGPIWMLLTGLCVAGCGAAFINSQLSGALVAFAPPAQAGTASAAATTLRQGGFALGVALLGAVAGIGPAPYAASFVIAAVAAAFGALVAWVLVEPPQ